MKLFLMNMARVFEKSRKNPLRSSRRVHLRLEAMEDRLVPSTLALTGVTGHGRGGKKSRGIRRRRGIRPWSRAWREKNLA
jgi:hypothetical protein